MKRHYLLTAVITLSLALTGCAAQGPREESGMVIGGLLGGMLGAQAGDHHVRPVAIIAGTLIGASIGGAIGSYMDETDRLRAGETLETVRTGVPTTWRNPDTGAQFYEPKTAVSVSLADLGGNEPTTDGWKIESTDSEGNDIESYSIDRRIDRPIGFVTFIFEEFE